MHWHCTFASVPWVLALRESCWDCSAVCGRGGSLLLKYPQLPTAGGQRVKGTAWHRDKEPGGLVLNLAWPFTKCVTSGKLLVLLCLSFLICNVRPPLTTPSPPPTIHHSPLPCFSFLYSSYYHLGNVSALHEARSAASFTLIATWPVCVCLCLLSDSLHWNGRSMSAGTVSCSLSTYKQTWHITSQSISVYGRMNE